MDPLKISSLARPPVRVPKSSAPENLIVDRFVPSTPTQTDIQIVGAEAVDPASVEKLRATAQRALDFFQENFGTAVRPLKFDLGGGTTSLHTGYNLETDTIGFPKMKNVKNSGLDSVDIINHEIFHALICQNYPNTCTAAQMADPAVLRLHEGLADYFAYLLNPDEHFGEDYLVQKPYLRSYQNDLTISLAPGPHAQGSALTSHLRKNNIGKEHLKEFLTQREFSLAGLSTLTPGLKKDLETDASFALPETVTNYKPSPTRRYRLQDGLPLHVEFNPNDALQQAHPQLHLDWSLESGLPSQHYVIQQEGQRGFAVSSKPGAEGEKVLALLYDGTRLLGSRPFYFGPILSPHEEGPDDLSFDDNWAMS